MKFIDAEKKLKRIAGNKYRSLEYDKTYNEDGTVKTKCSIYVKDPQGFYSGHDWKEAFAELRKAMAPKPIEEIPE